MASFFFVVLALISVVSLATFVHGASFAAGPQSKSAEFAPGSVVFLGDSLTSQWASNGLSVWRKFYEAIAINKGEPSFKTTDTIHQIEDGALEGLDPKVVVLLIGGNDLRVLYPANYVANNIRTIISMVWERLPNAHVLLLALLPADVPQIIIDQGKLVNELISAYDTSGRGPDKMASIIKFLDMGLEFGTSDGVIYRELYDWDGLHLSDRGYRVWANTMGETLEELLNVN